MSSTLIFCDRVTRVLMFFLSMFLKVILTLATTFPSLVRESSSTLTVKPGIEGTVWPSRVVLP